MQQTNLQDKNSLRVCLIGSTYPRSHDDNAVPWLRETVKRLRNRGHEVTILAPSYKGLPTHEIDGTEVVRFRYAPKKWEILTHEEGAPHRIRKKAFQLLTVPYLISGTISLLLLCRKKKFDLLNIHWPFPHNLMGVVAKVFFQIPIVSTFHGAELAMAKQKKWVARILRKTLNYSEEITCNSSHTYNQIQALCGRKSHIIPYGSTVEAKDNSGEENQVPIILFTGRHIQRKGVEYLIKAMPHILDQTPARLVVAGDGEYRKTWEQLSKSLNLEQYVQFTGFVSNRELEELYRKCDAYVLPAIHDDQGDTEGLGVVLVEALMHKKPVVASQVGGIVDIIKHEETGLLVQEKDEQGLAQSIVRLLNEKDFAKELGKKGFEYARWQFDWDRIVSRLEGIYKQSVSRYQTHKTNSKK